MPLALDHVLIFESLFTFFLNKISLKTSCAGSNQNFSSETQIQAGSNMHPRGRFSVFWSANLFRRGECASAGQKMKILVGGAGFG